MSDGYLIDLHLWKSRGSNSRARSYEAIPDSGRMATTQLTASGPTTDLQAKSIIDPTADDALVEFDRDVGNYGCPAYVSDSAIYGA